MAEYVELFYGVDVVEGVDGGLRGYGWGWDGVDEVAAKAPAVAGDFDVTAAVPGGVEVDAAFVFGTGSSRWRRCGSGRRGCCGWLGI